MTHAIPISECSGAEAALSPALLGHDLRAAISDVIGGLRLIDRDTLAPSTRMQLERVRAAGETLGRMMEEALAALPDCGACDGGHAAAAAQETAPANLHLPRLLYDAEMRWAGRAGEKGLGFGLRVGAGVPRVVAVNRIALERTLSNLLSNAIKYTDSGTIELRAEMDEDRRLNFRVRDNGPGFCAAALAHLFEPGARPDTGARPGSGLGLHIAKEMADRMGGEIAVRNAPEGGAEVMLSLPHAAWAPPATGADQAGLPDLSRVKVLLAEDSPTNQMLLGRMLAAMGAEWVVASDGIEALNWLDRESFDLALIDVEMPRLTGLEVIRALRARGGRQAQMPVLAVTAYMLRANREAIYAAGADLILTKPLGSVESLGQSIAAALDCRQPRPDTAAGDPAPEMNPKRLRHLLDITGPEDAPELLRRLLDDLSRVERAMVGALADPDWAELRAQTHVLIALSGAVGAERLTQLARLLNTAVHRHEAEALAEHGPEALRRLDDLIHLIARQSPPEARP